MLKSILNPIIEHIDKDKTICIGPELAMLQKKFVITQGDKNANGIAFVCKKIAHTLTKNFIYGPHVNATGLFTLDDRPLSTVIDSLHQYAKLKGIYAPNRQLPQFKIIMKMHKSD